MDVGFIRCRQRSSSNHYGAYRTVKSRSPSPPRMSICYTETFCLAVNEFKSSVRFEEFHGPGWVACR